MADNAASGPATAQDDIAQTDRVRAAAAKVAPLLAGGKISLEEAYDRVADQAEAPRSAMLERYVELAWEAHLRDEVGMPGVNV